MKSSLVLAPFDAVALGKMANEAVETQVRPYLVGLDLEILTARGPAWTGRWRGEVIGVAGFAEIYGEGSPRAAAWMVLRPMPRGAVTALAREVKRRIAMAPYRRIEADVEAGNGNARRWVELLGFRREGQEPKMSFFPNGGAAIGYVVLK